MPRVTVIWHVKEPSLRNDHRCRAEVKIISPSPVMATSPNVWKFSSGTKNSKNKHTTPGLSLFGMLMPWHNLYIYIYNNELYVCLMSLYFPLYVFKRYREAPWRWDKDEPHYLYHVFRCWCVKWYPRSINVHCIGNCILRIKLGVKKHVLLKTISSFNCFKCKRKIRPWLDSNTFSEIFRIKAEHSS